MSDIAYAKKRNGRGMSYGSYGKKYSIQSEHFCLVKKAPKKQQPPFSQPNKTCGYRHQTTHLTLSAPSFGKKQINAQLMRDALRAKSSKLAQKKNGLESSKGS